MLSTQLTKPTRGKPRHPVDVHVGQRIRTLRVLKGLSQEKLAELMECSFQQVQKYESGANRVSASRLYWLANIFLLSTDWFFEGLLEDPKKTEAPGITTQELRLLRAFRNLDDTIKASVYQMILATSRGRSQPATFEEDELTGLDNVLRPVGRVPEKPNYLTLAEAGKIWEYYRDEKWKLPASRSFVGTQWTQHPDGHWTREQRSTDGHMYELRVYPDSCQLLKNNELELS